MAVERKLVPPEAQLPLLPPTPTAATARLGPANIEFIDARSILSRASGRIGGAFKFSLNPYSGCGFGCSYCYARFFAPTPAEEEAWGTWVRAKQNAVRLIEKAIASRGSEALRPGDSIYMASVTDPYQPIEARLGLTRSILQTLLPLQPRLTIQTRSPIVARDIDLLAQFHSVRVNVSIPTDDEAVRLRYEPHAPAIGSRLDAVAALSGAGVPAYVCVAPMLPIADPVDFAARIRTSGAAGAYAQFFHSARQRFASNTPASVIETASAAGWTRSRYLRVAQELQAALAPIPLVFWSAEDARGASATSRVPDRPAATDVPRQPPPSGQFRLPA